jgi:ribonuclease BN (tRNA processing enzyme)
MNKISGAASPFACAQALFEPLVGQEENEMTMKKTLHYCIWAAVGLVLTLVCFSGTHAQTVNGFVVTIVGSGNPLLSAQRSGPSVLVEYQDTQFLVDCGPSSVSSLLTLDVQPEKITNLLFTHHHADHNADYISFAIGGWGMPQGRRELNLVGPTGTEALHQMVLAFYGTDLEYRTQVVGFPGDGMLTNVFIHELTGGGETFEMDGVTITTLPVPHTIETHAYRFEAGGQSVVISGDLTYTDEFAPFAHGADILVFDGQMAVDFSNFPPETAEAARQVLLNSHISNQEIAWVAAAAAPDKLVLTHLTGTMNLQENIELYRSAGYYGEVIEAYDGLVVTPGDQTAVSYPEGYYRNLPAKRRYTK